MCNTFVRKDTRVGEEDMSKEEDINREYYLCWSYNSAPRDCVVDCMEEINELLKSKGIYIRTYEPDDEEELGGYDFKMIFEIETKEKDDE